MDNANSENHYLPVMDLLGSMKPDPVSKAFKTDYERFESPMKIAGLVRMRSPRKLEFLAILSIEPGKGNFRRFLEACKERTDCICFWEILSPVMKSMLERYGFEPARTYELKEEITGMQWCKHKTINRD